MYAIRNKYFLCFCHMVLCLANSLLLGLHCNSRFYQLASVLHSRSRHLSNAIIAIHTPRPTPGGWHCEAKKKLLLDKRYSPQHYFCIPAIDVALSSVSGSARYLRFHALMQTSAVPQLRSSRGPPDNSLM
jgi:hypothetical protein